jgi:hypothetical protein
MTLDHRRAQQQDHGRRRRHQQLADPRPRTSTWRRSKATTDFNVSSAEGAAKILDAQGEAEAATHDANAQVYSSGGRHPRAGRAGRTPEPHAYAQTKGQQRAALAANGVTLDEGSSLRIQSDTDYASDVDASTIQANATKRRWATASRRPTRTCSPAWRR